MPTLFHPYASVVRAPRFALLAATLVAATLMLE